MKKITTELTKTSVIITIEAPECDTCVLELPVNMVSPQVSLQVASMISADPKIPQPIQIESNEKAE